MIFRVTNIDIGKGDIDPPLLQRSKPEEALQLNTVFYRLAKTFVSWQTLHFWCYTLDVSFSVLSLSQPRNFILVSVWSQQFLCLIYLMVLPKNRSCPRGGFNTHTSSVEHFS